MLMAVFTLVGSIATGSSEVIETRSLSTSWSWDEGQSVCVLFCEIVCGMLQFFGLKNLILAVTMH